MRHEGRGVSEERGFNDHHEEERERASNSELEDNGDAASGPTDSSTRAGEAGAGATQ